MPLDPFDEPWSRALCVVAHPDDLEYGGAVAIAHWTAAGREVRYVLATAGESGIDGLDPAECGPVREAEERAAAAQVGVSVVEFLGHRDGVVEYGLPLRRDIARAIRRHRPDLVVTGHFGLAWGAAVGGAANQADHRHVGLAALDACRDAGNRWIFPELVDEGHEPWNGVKWLAVAGSPTPTHGIAVSSDDLDRGVASLQAHAAYLAGLGGDFDARGFLQEPCRAIGSELGTELAVAFERYSL
jgi:LmbE family N-acetylglucosaminyl deacetylase